LTIVVKSHGHCTGPGSFWNVTREHQVITIFLILVLPIIIETKTSTFRSKNMTTLKSLKVFQFSLSEILLRQLKDTDILMREDIWILQRTGFFKEMVNWIIPD